MVSGGVLVMVDAGANLAVDRVAWFRSALEGSTGPLTDEEMHVLTERYVNRDAGTAAAECVSFIAREDEQLAEIKAQRRPGRPPTTAEEQINQRKEAEQREHRAGLWVPELRDEEGREKLERWGGEWGGMNNLKFVRVVKAGMIKASSFPPKGLS